MSQRYCDVGVDNCGVTMLYPGQEHGVETVPDGKLALVVGDEDLLAIYGTPAELEAFVEQVQRISQVAIADERRRAGA